MKENKRGWGNLKSGFPVEENLAIDRKYFSLIEEQFKQQSNPLERKA